jgi:hypothetical protein
VRNAIAIKTRRRHTRTTGVTNAIAVQEVEGTAITIVGIFLEILRDEPVFPTQPSLLQILIV